MGKRTHQFEHNILPQKFLSRNKKGFWFLRSLTSKIFEVRLLKEKSLGSFRTKKKNPCPPNGRQGSMWRRCIQLAQPFVTSKWWWVRMDFKLTGYFPRHLLLRGKILFAPPRVCSRAGANGFGWQHYSN